MTLTRRQLAAAALCASFALAACGDDDDASHANPDAATAGCSSANPCDEGFVCVEERCVAGGEVDVAIDSAARACEVLLRDGKEAQAVDVRFGASVKGSFVRRAPRLALSFVAAEDKTIAASDVVPTAVGAGLPELVTATCTDAKGKALPKSAFALGGVR